MKHAERHTTEIGLKSSTFNYTHSLSRAYLGNPIGNIVAIKDDAQQTHFFQNAVVSPNSKYTYDALYRLLSGTGREHVGAGQTSESDYPINTPVPQNNNAGAVVSYTQQYQYDPLGNILKLIHQATGNNWTRDYFYESGKNYLKGHSSGATEYTYDAQGNMTSMPHLANMQWDIFDNLKEVDLGGGGTAWYVYNSQGVRIRKVIENGANKTERIYLGESNEVYREYISGSLQKERETLHMADDTGRIAITETLTIDNGSPIGSPTPITKYQLNNLLGSACLELDSSANILTYEEYHPFGTTSYRLGTSSAEVSLKRYRYVGKERDDETGLYYYGARYYAAWLCRFVSVDPLKDKFPYYSSYQYAGNRPINAIDLDGAEALEKDGQPKGQQNHDLTPYLDRYEYKEVNSIFDVADNFNYFLYNSIVANLYNSSSALINAVYNYDDTIAALGDSYLYEIYIDFYSGDSNVAIEKLLEDIKSVSEELYENTTWDGTIESLTSLENYEFAVALILSRSTNLPKGTKPARVGPSADAVAAKGAKTFFDGAKYSPKVLRQMSKADDLFHGFPKSVDGYATKFGQWSTKVGADGKTYQWLKMQGSYGGKTGTFEFIKDANGVINHRFFNVH